MSISACLSRLGSLSLAATVLFACSQTANLSRSVAPSAPAPQSITSVNESSTAPGPSEAVVRDSAEAALPATQVVRSHAFIPPIIASALAAGVNFTLADAKGMTSSDLSSPVSSAELFGELPSYSDAPFQRWLDVLIRFSAQETDPQYACVTDSTHICALAWWKNFVAKLRVLPLNERVLVVNDVLNRVSYVSAEDNWGDPGYWETPLEFLTHAGQCQDYANAKYLALAESGVPDSIMRFVVVRDRQQQLDHAVLVVYVDGEPLLLDNQNRAVLPADKIDRYAPYYALNKETAWTYPPPVPSTILAGQTPYFARPTFELARY